MVGQGQTKVHLLSTLGKYLFCVPFHKGTITKENATETSIINRFWTKQTIIIEYKYIKQIIHWNMHRFALILVNNYSYIRPWFIYGTCFYWFFGSRF